MCLDLKCGIGFIALGLYLLDDTLPLCFVVLMLDIVFWTDGDLRNWARRADLGLGSIQDVDTDLLGIC